ncbi:RNA-binding protein [Paraburkholderia bonniea]|uniref:RNA-binding protein n=1 Tax=Paraburkholderia bonniea TaxID=2152891 RepID=UPI0012924C5B|nr:RNA-binding protein [Paraburkholderia bonniea]WJF91078.1 RNA-binding protein [Paraburkholderia bonniea]WJF94393.1 RNA-binding protein [Paraburkholderia bonniea]
MNLMVWSIPESCSEQQVQEFLSHELGHYAKRIVVYKVGTPGAYAQVELDASIPYVGDMIARQIQGKLLGGVSLQASTSLFDDGPPPPG